MGLLVNPGSPQTDRVIETMQAASRAKGIQLRILKAGTESEIGTAFDSLVQQPVDALVVQADPLSTVPTVRSTNSAPCSSSDLLCDRRA